MVYYQGMAYDFSYLINNYDLCPCLWNNKARTLPPDTRMSFNSSCGMWRWSGCVICHSGPSAPLKARCHLLSAWLSMCIPLDTCSWVTQLSVAEETRVTLLNYLCFYTCHVQLVADIVHYISLFVSLNMFILFHPLCLFHPIIPILSCRVLKRPLFLLSNWAKESSLLKYTGLTLALLQCLQSSDSSL